MTPPAFLYFGGNIYVYLLAFFILPVSIFYGARFFGPGEYNNAYLSKDVTGCVKGISIFVVILHHLSQRIAGPGLFYSFTRYGYLSVSLFFFLSGYSLMVSLLKNPSYLDNFLRKRLSRVYVPVLVINTITLASYHFIYGFNWTITGIIKNIAGIELVDPILWFVNAILIFYVVFFIAFRFFSVRAGAFIILAYSFVYFAVCRYTGFGDWWYNTCFCFPLGVMVAYKYREFTAFMRRNYLPVTAAVIFIFSSTFYIGNWWLFPAYGMYFFVASSISCVFMMLVFLMKVNVGNRLWVFIGVISYEMYLVHMKVYNIYFSYVKISRGYSLYIFLALVIAAAWGFNKLFDYINQPQKTAVVRVPADVEPGDAEPEPES